MKVRANAQFESTLPDDGIEDDDGWVQYPSRNIAEAMQEILTRLECVNEPIESLGEAGWEFGFVYRKQQLVCRVTVIEEYLVTFYDPSFVRQLFKRPPHPAFVEVLRKVGDELARDPRFLNVRWFRHDEVMTDVPGAASPVDEG